MIKKYADTILVASLIIGALGVAAAVLFTNRPVGVSAMPAAQPLVAPVKDTQSVPDVSSNEAPLPKNKYPIAKTQNNLKIELLQVQLNGGVLYADICFDFPSDNPAWNLGGPDNLKLSNGVAEIGVYSIELIPDRSSGFLKKDAQGKFIGRCDHVGFPVAEGFALENLKISIGKLVTDLSESPDCNKVQAKLDSKSSGVKIKCINEPGMSGVEITAKPQEMSDAQAQKFIADALIESADGPWEFEIGVP